MSICYLVCMRKTLTEPLSAHSVSQVKKDVFRLSWKLCEFLSWDFSTYFLCSVLCYEHFLVVTSCPNRPRTSSRMASVAKTNN